MKKLLLLLPLILLSGCISPIEEECTPDCETNDNKNAIVVVDSRLDYYKSQFGYYAYKFKVLGTNSTFEYEEGTWFYLEEQYDIGKKLFVTSKDNQLRFFPILYKN